MRKLWLKFEKILEIYKKFTSTFVKLWDTLKKSWIILFGILTRHFCEKLRKYLGNIGKTCEKFKENKRKLSKYFWKIGKFVEILRKF